MQNRSLFFGLFTALVVVLVAIALFMSGGLTSGRAEVRDQARMQAIQTLSRLATCLANEAGGRLPDELAPTTACDIEIDPDSAVAEEAFPYHVLSEDLTLKWQRFEICGAFEKPELVANWNNDFNKETGCVAFTYYQA